MAVALDTSDRNEYMRWCRLFGRRVGVLKVGLEAFCRWGPWVFQEACDQPSRVFADLKLHDIPNTVGQAVRAIRDQGVDYLTVHSAGGTAMLEAAALSAVEDLTLLAVTVLTHLDEKALVELDLPGDASTRALDWARLASSAGCRGAVCSSREVAALRRDLGKEFVLVTPGIRPPGYHKDDQRRTASPAEALAAGSNLLVIGRPLTRAADPDRALDALESAITLGPNA